MQKLNYTFLAIFISFIFVIIISYRVNNRFRIKKELKNLNLEKKSIENLIEDAQKRRYEENTMSKRAYKVVISKCKNRIRKVEKRVLVLQKKIGKKKAKLIFTLFH